MSQSSEPRASHTIDQRDSTLDYFHRDTKGALIAKHRAALMPAVDRVALETTYGTTIGPWLDAKLEAKARELMDRYQQAWVAAFGPMNSEHTLWLHE